MELSLTIVAAASSSTPSRDDAVPENTTPRQRLSPHPEIQRLLEWSSADFGEHAVVEQHETEEHGDYPYDPRTGDTDDEEGERGDVGNSTYHFRDRRRRRRFSDGDTEEEEAESDKEEETKGMGVDDGDDLYEDDTHMRPPALHTQRRGISQRRHSRTTLVYEEEDIYEDDTLRQRSTRRSRDTSNTPASQASDIPNLEFPSFNEFWRQQSREKTAESDKQSDYSELLRAGLEMS